MSFFRNIRSTLASSRKSSSRDTTPVRSCSSRPASVISSRRDSTTSSTLQRGDTFILNDEEEQQQQQQRGNDSNSSTLEKKSKKSKVFSKFSTFTKRKKTPSPEEVASYEHHPSDTATNTYYKWRSDGADRLLDYDAHADPFNFLYEHKGKQTSDLGMQRQSSLGSNSNSSGSFDSSTYRKSKTPTHLREQLEQLKTHSNDDLLEEDDEREKYKTVTLNSFRKSFRDRLLQQQTEAPHNPAWFVEVPATAAAKTSQSGDHRHESKENRPDFLVFDNDNYRPQSRSPLRDRPSRSATRSPVKRNETFRVAQPMLRHVSPSPTHPPPHSASATALPPASAIRIEIKNSILPHSPGRLVPVGVAKPMPTTEYYAQRLLASSAARQMPPPGKWYRSQSQHAHTQHQHQQQQLQQQQQQPRGSGRYQTLVHIGSEQGKLSPAPTRGRAPTRVQLYGSKPSSRQQQQQQQQQQSSSSTYFGGHYNAPVPASVSAKPLSSSRHSSGGGGGVGVGVASVNWGRREQPTQRAAAAAAAAPAPRRNRSPIKIPWR